MAINIRVGIEGSEKIARRLAVLPLEVSGPALEESARPGAEIIKAKVQEKAPRGKGDFTYKGKRLGHIADSIRVELTKEQDARKVEFSIGTGRHHFYGRFLEFGHALVRVTGRYRKGGRIYRIKKVIGSVAPRPFMRPGFDESWPDAQKAVAAELKRRLGIK